MKSIITKDLKIALAESFENAISRNYDYIYVCMGRSVEWPDEPTEEFSYDTTDYKNKTAKQGIVAKKITGSDVQAVAPRVDWGSGNVYTAYDHTANLFASTAATELANGTVTVTLGLPAQVNANAGFNLDYDFDVGDIIRISQVDKEVISINTAGDYLTVNTAYASAYADEISYRVDSVSPNFYVRNTNDQVFKCLFNNGDAQSTIMPEITIGGQLPENPYIQTSDGYKWKYLYTIPSGLKKKFFTESYMPVIRDTTVYNNAIDGRIDIVQVIDGGDGYFSGSNVSGYPVATVTGDGTDAAATVDVVNGVITEVNITAGGAGYTFGNVTISDPLKISGNSANLRVVISPQYGHGSDPVRELGASFEMISVDFSGNMEGLIPTGVNGSNVEKFRQIFVVRNPRLSANTDSATAAQYLMCTKLFVENRINFNVGGEVYVSSSGSEYASAIFKAIAVYYDDSAGTLYVNNIEGDADSIVGREIYEKDNTLNYAQVFSVSKPSINTLSGEMLYIENRSPVTRSLEQTETAKIVIEF